MPSFYIPLSGLNADSTALNTIANNLSNMSTTGFKSQTTNFSDLFYQQVGTTGSGDEIQAGTGVQVSSNSTDFTGGSISSTSVATDAAINGTGFFVLDAGSGSQLYTRDGNFQISSTGTLESTDGQAVMGYSATNGVVSTSGGLTDLTVPTGQVMQPSATTSMSVMQTLDSTTKVGGTTSGQVEVYDSLGKNYEATITYTNLGNNKWSYAITLPDTLTAGAATTAATTMSVAGTTPSATAVAANATVATPAVTTVSSTVAAGGTTTAATYSFGSYTDPTTGLSATSTVDTSSTLTITGPTAGGTATTALPTFTGTPETIADYATDLQSALTTAGITGVTVSSNASGVLSINGPSTMVINGGVKQDMKGTTNNYTFQNNATVAATTNLTISGETSTGATATITAPTVTSGETVAQYATALTSALSTAGIENVTVSSTTGQLSIVGANMTIAGSVVQNLADTTVNYDFGSTATVSSTTALTITGPTVSGTPATAITVAPTVTAGETVAQYAAALNSALTAAGIDTSTSGVKVTSSGGQLSIVGPAATLKVAGTASQDLSASTINYDFGTSGGSIATVDSTTSLKITGLTATGATATITAPTVTAGETLTTYVNDLNKAITTAGIAGVTVSSTSAGVLSITGANLSTTGKVVQDPVVSSNASGTLTFDSSGNLVSPAADVSNITFAGLSDSAATMNMTWDLLGTSGTATISQTDATSAQSAQTQNGYTSGTYQSFTIGSDGTITADYSNTQKQIVGQIGLASVTNEQGLVAVGSTEYQTTAASGSASVGVAGTGDRGTLEGSSLEASNVNISTEFSDLIIAQRAFEANSKAVTTFDTVTQEAINMIH
jgi:flagellar hook protein FlgE